MSGIRDIDIVSLRHKGIELFPYRQPPYSRIVDSNHRRLSQILIQQGLYVLLGYLSAYDIAFGIHKYVLRDK